MEEGEALNSPESKSKREKAPGIEHVDDSTVVKVGKSETRNEEKLPSSTEVAKQEQFERQVCTR